MNNLDRRTFLGGSLGVAAIGLLAACTSNDSSSTSGSATASASSPTGNLAFDASTYTEQTTTITTDAGDQEVAYRFFGPITYVENRVIGQKVCPQHPHNPTTTKQPAPQVSPTS